MSIHIIDKQEGQTPLEALEFFRNTERISPEIPITYAGRLDPMASGVLILLSGDDVHKKEAFLDLPKTYEAEILFGVKTDTYDVLGLITGIGSEALSPQALIDILKKLEGTFDLPYPPYSSKPVEGKPLFVWAREGKLQDIQIPQRTMSFSNIVIENEQEINSDELKKSVVNKIIKVRGDFRQKQIVDNWTTSNLPPALPLISIKLSCTSGSYIRSFAHLAGEKTGTGAILYNLKRTSVGKYSLRRF